MKFLDRLKQRLEADRAATEASQAHLEQVLLTEPDVDREHQTALRQLHHATEQALRLTATDSRNHYSESLTNAFRGRTA